MTQQKNHQPQTKFEDLMVSSAGLGTIRPNRIRDRLAGTCLKLAGFLWPIRFAFRLLERHSTMGQMDLFNNTLLIEGNLTEPETLSAVWHEILEVLNKKYEWSITHELLSSIEVNTFEALINNPHFVTELLRYAKQYSGTKTATKNKKA
jgi:hypothetical protein